MVKIRLKRTGTRNRACFRVVVMDSRASRDGKSIEEIGFYDPILKVEKMDMDRYNYWTGVGAQVSETVADIAHRVSSGILLADKVRKPSISRKAKAKAEEEAKAKAEAEAAAAAAAAEAEAPAADAE
ncbi:MAG: 30S ribosomal protein S16 [Lentisphaeria bacterium]|nr:30S ribosomal protein S16 [Lentisphaeria bacterium]